jgi:hypothetical protein
VVGGRRSGRFPKPVKLGPRITAWRVEHIRALVEQGAGLMSAQMTQKNEGRANAAKQDTQCNSSTWSSTLDLLNGAAAITITETENRVFMAFSGARPRPEDTPRIVRFLLPLFERYEREARQIAISASHLSETAIVFERGVAFVPNAELADLPEGRA